MPFLVNVAAITSVILLSLRCVGCAVVVASLVVSLYVIKSIRFSNIA